jgi:aspartate kinase
MGQTTDNLISLAHEISNTPDQREIDMLITAGERITMALLSLTLQDKAISSISFTGSQSGILTDNSHGNAKILNVNAFRINEELNKGKIVIVAGFQGVSLEKEITTLGRGGSDTTAVAIACFLNAELCEIFTDVDGVYTADPRNVDNTQKIAQLSFEEMLYLSHYGSKVLHYRAAEFAYKYNIPIEIKSSKTFNEGTMINDKMEETSAKVIAHKESIFEYKINIKNYKEIDVQTEIFDMKYENQSLLLWVEKRNENQLLEEFKNKKIKYIKLENEYAIINILGYRICKDISFFNSLYQTLSEYCESEFTIQNNSIGVQIKIKQEKFNNTIKILHEKYVIGG